MAIQQGDVLEISPRMEFNGVEDVVNTYQFRYTDATPITDTQGINDLIGLMEAIYTLFLSTMTIIQFFRDIRVSNKTQSTVYGVFPWPTLTIGGDASDPVPPGVCVLSNFSTGVARVTPRKFWGVMCEDNIESDGTWHAGIVAIAAAASALMMNSAPSTTYNWDYGYLSSKTASFEVATGATGTDIPAYQRRRKQGRGV